MKPKWAIILFIILAAAMGAAVIIFYKG